MSDHFIKRISVSLLRAPLSQSFRTALGEHKVMDNVLFTLKLSDGTKGFGEAAVAPHITAETVAETTRNLRLTGNFLIGQRVSDYLRISTELHARLPKNKSAVAAIEMALLDAFTRQWKIPLWKFFGQRARRLKTDITIVIADLAETEETVKKFYHQGFRTFKIKIGRDQDLDFKRVVAVQRLTRNSHLILDANQGYSAEETLQFLKRIQRAGVRPILLEQPVPKNDWEGLKKVSRSTKIPVCADESVASLADALRAIREKAVPVINIKLMKCGMLHAREIAGLARCAGIKLMIGGMMESSLAMTAAAHLAAGMGCFDYIDLDTPFFIQRGFDKNPYLSACGVYDLRNAKKGIGIEPMKKNKTKKLKVKA